MKKAVKILAGTLLPAGLGYMLLCTQFPFFPNRSKCMSAGVINTRWKQMGGFQKYTPDAMRTGCWSTALAQIAYYHRLKPFGHIAYISRNGYSINELMDSLQFDFSCFAATIDSVTPESTIDQMAKYNYYAALIVRKDFGTDRYMNKLAPAELFEHNLKVSAARYISWHKMLPNTLGKLEKVIYEELNHERPLFLHFANLKDFGHSVVIDGYCYHDDAFMVHINQGQGGPTDGWYNFYKGILRDDDDALRVIYTIKPQ